MVRDPLATAEVTYTIDRWVDGEAGPGSVLGSTDPSRVAITLMGTPVALGSTTYEGARPLH